MPKTEAKRENKAKNGRRIRRGIRGRDGIII